MHTRKLHTTLLAGPLAVLLAAAAIAGCGGSSTNGVESKSASEIVAEAQKAAAGAKSVHVAGSVTNAGAKLALDLQIEQGKGAKGTISQGPLSFQIVRVGESAYIKGSAAFYEHFAGSQAAKLLQGKWLQAPANSGEFQTLGSLTDMQKLIGTVLGQNGTLAKGGTSTIEGQKAIAVKDTTSGNSLYVATTGKPYPIQIAKSGSGKVSFKDWNEPVSISAPSNSINIEKLKAKA